MKAVVLLNERYALDVRSFVEIVIWGLPKPLSGSVHAFKYRLAYVVDGECVLRYDNETGKGDHRHVGRREEKYSFVSREALLDDFFSDVERMRRE